MQGVLTQTEWRGDLWIRETDDPIRGKRVKRAAVCGGNRAGSICLHRIGVTRDMGMFGK